MSLSSHSGLKRRRLSSPEVPNADKRLREPLQREYGDTFASGNAYVHNGDHIHYHQGASPFQSGIEQMQVSLAFSGMHDRYESLREAQDGTYKWILTSDISDEYDFRERRQCMENFFRWYETGSGLYWVSGKPGSGKSTLMKYLVEHIGSCSTVSHQPGLIILSFFLWVRGGNLQRSKLGCLKSLLWQLLQNPIAQVVTLQQCRLCFKNAWSEQRLQAALFATLRQLDGPILLFIDGLDEGDDHEHFLDFLYKLNAIDKVKTCVSSRPEPVFRDKLQDMQRLKLHQINSGDIRCFVHKTLLQDPRVAAMNSSSSPMQQDRGIQKLVRSIEFKSEGVFLWVRLVVGDLLKGISNKDDIETLSRRLERLPGDISDLYEDMLRRSQDDLSLYKEDVSLYLSLVLHNSFDLVEFCFAVDDDLRHEFLQPTILDNPTEAMRKIPCATVKTWIRARTAGLVDVIYVKYQISRFKKRWALAHSWHQEPLCLQIAKYRSFKVHIVHRTAHDFLLGTAAGNLLLSPSTEMDTKVRKICFQTKLVSEAIIPGLRGLSIGTEEAVDVVGCRTCKDEDILAGLRDQGEKVFNFLHNARLIQPDKDFAWAAWFEAGYGIVRTEAPARVVPFPSSRYSEVDLAQILVLARRYGAVKTWLSKPSLSYDSESLSMLLAPLIAQYLWWHGHGHERSFQAENDDFWSLLNLLVSQNADVRKAITTDSGESLLSAGEVVGSLACSDSCDPQLDRYMSAMRFAHTYCGVTFTALCYDCHTIWFEKTGSRWFEMWGNFSMRSLLPGSSDRSLEGKDDRALIWVSASGVTSDTPTLWAISEADSPFFVRIISLGHSRMLGPGRYYAHFYGVGDELQRGLDEILGRSKVVSFAGAMQHMGKSEKTIRIFYAKEAKRMAQEPAELQKGWKEWFWGDIDPPTQHAIEESTDLLNLGITKAV